MTPLLLAVLAGCGGKSFVDDSVPAVRPREAPWDRGLPPATQVWSPTDGLQPRRTVIHLHSPWSHDACDDAGLEPVDDPNGTPDADCLADLREGLCTVRMDAAFLTDHPSFSAFQEWDRLLLDQPGDKLVTEGGKTVGFTIACEDGHEVLWLPGHEDDLMPVALDEHVPGDGAARDALLNQSDAAALTAMHDAGGTVLMAHTEGRDLAWLEQRQDEGLDGVEIFNLHAMFAPDIREEDLGLTPFGWAEGIEAFTNEGGGEPDLLFLAVLQHQPPSLQKFDALLARGPIVGTGGTDAHQNVLNYDLPDGERGDSYRRMLRWFSNVLLTDGTAPSDYQEALEAGRNYVVFEALGTPVDFEVWYRDENAQQPVGSTVTAGGTLVVGCPTVALGAPYGPDAPEVAVRVVKDGETFASACGNHVLTEPGIYRVEVEITPYHLAPFLGPDPAPWIKPYPWVYSNAFRVQ